MEQKDLQYAQKMAPLIAYETISAVGEYNAEKFHGFHSILKETFPRLFATAAVEEFDGNLLLRWQGQDPSQMPILFMSHHDVVEASGAWTHPPFGGEIADGKLWGRGTLDTKGSLFCMLCAAEELIGEGFVPPCDIYFESACNEETTGNGSEAIAKLLCERGIRFSFVLDEGGYIMPDPIGGADGTFAMIGVGEKGCTDLRFVATSKGGHASTPPKNSPLVRLGKFMVAAEKSHLFKAKVSPTLSEMFRRIAPTMKGPLSFILKHNKFFTPLLCRVLPSISPKAAAMLKTTLAFTMAGGSNGNNVLPNEAFVVGNMRSSHHQGGEESIGAIRKLAARYDVRTEVLDPGFTSSVTDFRSEGYKTVEKALGKIFDGVIPAPYIMTGASDCRYFSLVSDCCLRFVPIRVSDDQIGTIHGFDENIDVSAIAPAVDFYKLLMRGENLD